jgi:hypothetical protein
MKVVINKNGHRKLCPENIEDCHTIFCFDLKDKNGISPCIYTNTECTKISWNERAEFIKNKLEKIYDLSGKIEFSKQQEEEIIKTAHELFQNYNGDEFLDKEYWGLKFIDIVINHIRRK